MKRSIIITDLTRFSNEKEKLCIAGIDPETSQCIRPLPYFPQDWCKKQDVRPETILSGDFTPRPDTETPHTEDRNRLNVSIDGRCSKEVFRDLLRNSACRSIKEGFGVDLPNGQKYIPRQFLPELSIITITVEAQSIEVFQDQYGKIKAHVACGFGEHYPFLPITALGVNSGNHEEVNYLVRAQEEVFVRIGLGRPYKAPDGRDGFWLQVNGIYSFPENHIPGNRYG